jgi:hypothetical protein
MRCSQRNRQDFELEVPFWSVSLVDSPNHCQDGLLEVELLGEVEIDRKCSIKLPASTVQFGDRINVNSSQLKKKELHV